MKSRPPLFARLAALFRWRKPAPVSLVPPPRVSKVRGIEPLEGRIAPAALIDARTVTFNDLDGDLITVKFTKDLFDPTKSFSDPVNNLDDIFRFTDGTTASAFDSTGPQQLQLLDMTKAGPFVNKADGTSILITAAPSGGGDGFTKVGAIEANNLVLATVRVDGDLGQIDCGRPSVAIGLNALIVNSLFKDGAATQLSTTPASDALESKIIGQLTTLRVATDLHGYVHSVDGTSLVGGGSQVTAPAKIGTVIIGGSVVGNATEATTSNSTGLIESQRTIGTVQVLGVGDGSNTGGLIGGGGFNSGTILAGTGITSVTIADSIVGGGGANSGAVIAKRALASISVGDDLVGGTAINVGGTATNSGSIQARALGTATIADNVLGGGGANSGAITIERGATSIVISGTVLGGGGSDSGGVSAGGPLGSVLVRGNLTGGDGNFSGSIIGQADIGTARVLGTVTGDAGDRSGTIMAGGKIATVVAGELVGGAGPGSGSIFSGFDGAGDITTAAVNRGMTGGTGISSGSIIGGAIGSLRVGTAAQTADVQGGAGSFSGSVIADGTIGSARIFGALLGGGGASSGAIIAHDVFPGGLSNDLTAIGNIGSIIITGKIAGGAGAESGRIAADVSIGSLSAAALEGGGGADSGSIAAGLVRPGGIGAAAFSGAITSVASGADPSIIVSGRIGTLTVGAGVTDGVIRAGRNIGSVTVDGAVNNTVISAVGVPAPTVEIRDLAIGRILVRGNVADSQILAGYDTTGVAVNADASIGTVRVIGNWTASDVVAGVQDTNGDGFGNADDVKIAGGTDRADIISQIAAINVSGTIAGTASSGDHFGFTAQRIVAFRNGLTPLGFTAVPNQSFDLGATGDVTAREVAV